MRRWAYFTHLFNDLFILISFVHSAYAARCTKGEKMYIVHTQRDDCRCCVMHICIECVGNSKIFIIFLKEITYWPDFESIICHLTFLLKSEENWNRTMFGISRATTITALIIIDKINQLKRCWNSVIAYHWIESMYRISLKRWKISSRYRYWCAAFREWMQVCWSSGEVEARFTLI